MRRDESAANSRHLLVTGGARSAVRARGAEVFSPVTMSLVVRLQFLPAIANSSDIRQFFSGLNIPAGCVYITGGKYGEAYIVFATLEDAQKALERTGQPLKDSSVHLTSSNEEVMRRALDVYRIGPNPAVSAAPTSEATQQPPDTRHPSSCSYLYMYGLPLEATRRDIQKFFRGLPVEDILHLRVINGGRLGKAIIKFSNRGDATEALRFNNRPICLSPVIVKPSDEEEWDDNGGDDLAVRQRSPPRPVKERERSRSRSPVRRRRSRRPSPPYVREYFVHLINLSYRADKQDIKSFFNVHMDDSQITFLYDREGKRTREGFAMFTSPKDYRSALEFHKDTFKDRTINILPISKREMADLIHTMKTRSYRDHRDRKSPPRRSSRERKFLYLRNFPIDVAKANVQKFFTGHTVKEDDIILLHDCSGNSLGEALVKYADEREASKAEKQNNQTYQGFKILLSRITEEQMKDLQKGNQVEKAVWSEAGDLSGTTSVASVATSGEALVPDSSDVAMRSDSESVSPSNKESEAPSGSDVVPVTPSIPNSPTWQSPTDVNGGDETPSKNNCPTQEANGGSKEAEALSEFVPATPSMQSSPPQEANGCNKEAEAPSGSEVTPSMQRTPPDGANGGSKEAPSGIVQGTSSGQSSPPQEHTDNVNGADHSPPIQNDPTQDRKGGHEEPTHKGDKTKTAGMTLLFVRNLPTSVTAAEILDFFQGYKVSSVNLKNIERGEATVRMSNDVDAESAINSLNKREVGQKLVLLSLT